MNPDRVVGHVWGAHVLVPDGQGGLFSEPTARYPVFFGDLDPPFQRLIISGLQAPSRAHRGPLVDQGEAQPA